MSTEKNNKKLEVAKKIVGGIAKFCVSAFFGALAADLVNRSDANKMDKGIAIAGGLLVGSMMGDKCSDYVCCGLDQLSVHLPGSEDDDKKEEAEA